MSFTETLPDDTDQAAGQDAIGGLIVLPEPEPEDPVAADGNFQSSPELEPIATAPVPEIVSAYASNDNKFVYVTISQHTKFFESFGINAVGEDPDPIKIVQPNKNQKASRLSIYPKVPVFVSPKIKLITLESNSYANEGYAGPTVLKVEVNELSPSGFYVVEIDSTTDAFGSAWNSKKEFQAGGEAVVRNVGGDSSGKILPAILRGMGAVCEDLIGVPSTRTVEVIGYETSEVRLETTAHFPDSGQVYIGGRLFSYASRGTGLEAGLVGLEALEPLGDPIPVDTEVLLDVTAIFPD